jgi:structural maintenance of chromosome 4
MQEVKAAAAEALKEMAAYEKQEVGLEEKRKHTNSKAKKLKKSLQDVKFASSLRVNVSANRLDHVRMRALGMMHSVPSKRMGQR